MGVLTRRVSLFDTREIDALMIATSDMEADYSEEVPDALKTGTAELYSMILGREARDA